MLLEQHLIEYCSPTLASLKTASLFNHSYSAENELDEQLCKWNSYLQKKGVFLLELCRRDGKALIYVYRRSHLQKDLRRPGVFCFLRRYGYQNTEVDDALGKLRERMKQGEEFPHEIGVFLGYPLGDVIGFIRNGGRNCKCSGCWKVYCNECEASRAFTRYQKCKRVYLQKWGEGRSVLQLTVAI